MPKVSACVGADPDRDDRLAEGDDDDQPVALGEVVGDELPSLGAEEVGLGHVETERDRPQRSLLDPVELGGDDEQAGADRGADRESVRRLAEVRVVAAAEPHQHDLSGADDHVAAGEDEPEVVERLGDAERDHEQRRHRREHRQPDRPLLGVDDAGQPGVGGPGPPEDAEDEQPLRDPLPGRLVRHQRRALGQREHEDEIEEELERRHIGAVAKRGRGVWTMDARHQAGS